MHKQLDIFADQMPKKTINKNLRLIELFAGIGAQAKALEVLGVKFEHWKTCEWAYNSIIAYNSIHMKDKTNYAKDLTKEQLLEYLNGNISIDYNKPADLNKKSIEWLRNCYNSCKANNNLTNIMNVHGDDLQIEDQENNAYLLTYSFPCQDLSIAGKRAGMSTSQAEGGTRSGLLWEVERILKELHSKGKHIDILLMENVPQVIQSGSIKDFQKWRYALEQLGYTNYCEVLNAKDYGIPQNRQRCFMVSIYGDYHYEFPLKVNLKYKLKDFLENEVDKSYYLSEKKVNQIVNWKTQQNPLETMDKVSESGITPTLTARGAGEEHSGMILINEGHFKPNEIVDIDSSELFKRNHDNEITPTLVTHSKFEVVQKVGNYGNGHHAKDIISEEGLMPTITTGNHGLGQTIAIKNNNSKGYELATEGDGIDISTRMESHRGTVQKGSCQTLTCQGVNNVGVVVKESKVIAGIGEKKSNSGTQYYQQDRIYDGDIAITVATCCNPYYLTKGNSTEASAEHTEKRSCLNCKHCQRVITKDYNEYFCELSGKNIESLYEEYKKYCGYEPKTLYSLRIRKLTPLECLKLMGFEKEDYESMVKAGLSDAAIYHCAGDSIVVTCLVGIIGQLYGQDTKKTIEEYVERVKSE